MRGIESAVAVILLLIMSVALVAVLYMIFGPALKHASKTTASSMSSSAKQQAQQANLSNEKAACSNLGQNSVFLQNVIKNTVQLTDSNVKASILIFDTKNNTSLNRVNVPGCVYNDSGVYRIAIWNGTTFVVNTSNATVNNTTHITTLKVTISV